MPCCSASATHASVVANETTKPTPCRIAGGVIAAIVAVVALALFIAILVAPQVAFIAGAIAVLGGPTVAAAVTGTLAAVAAIVMALFVKPCACIDPTKKNAVPPQPNLNNTNNNNTNDDDDATATV